MASNCQAAPLVASPSYPNSIAWSKENLVAIASGHLITILNAALLAGPRGLITLSPNKPFPVGVVRREDLLTPCLMSTCLSRDFRPCARSISWSDPGFAPNSGSFLALCTTEGRVKLYRAPFCEFSAEWVEVLDISDLLYDYLESINFGELSASLPSFSQKQANAGFVKERGCDTELHGTSGSENARCRKREILSRRVKRNEYSESPVKERENDLPLITAEQYASRSSLLSSLVVAWSPVLQLSGISPCFSNKCAILAVGGKSGNISFWKFNEPKCYTVEHGSVSVDAMLIGLLQAHKSWITSISWGTCAACSSKSQLLLATGSSDGSVKIWLGDVEELIQSSDANKSSFTLLNEVTAVTLSPISTISLIVPIQSQDKVVLAIGKGSGSIEAWICHIFSNRIQSAGIYDAHDQVVTGLAWAFDGCCLYSSSQNNSVRSWVLHGNYLHEVPFPSKFPWLRNSTDLSQVSDQCFGLALSPGELMVAVVRSFDANLLNQMYQARTQKAVVEFFWIGGQSLEIPSEKHLSFSSEPSSDFSERDLFNWETNILQSLKTYENVDKLLVLWDILAALLAFKKLNPTFVENLLFKWITSWFLDYQSSISIEKILSHVHSMLPKISSRKIHLLNIICRRLMLSDERAGTPKREQHKLTKLNNDEAKVAKVELWNKLLFKNEKELQERLVAFNFAAALSRATCSPKDFPVGTNWFPIGVPQMQQWVAINGGLVHNQLKVLSAKVEELGSRIHSVCEYTMEESCSFCLASVPLESEEVAWCKGSKSDDGSKESHRLSRCMVSMQLCSVTAPMWFCICCQRWAAKLAPQTLFTMSKSPLAVNYDSESFALFERPKPLCPYCGILLQRAMPDFLLSACPV
ncbi:uncharacterized protein LOC103720062 [Phoenix dactylifera]|uniref:Uncharacterized protein LOC103720062 n=1 Tax=Phoenix dactylifera TaxID=42345 RepID=A0A8B9A629_PHODC|nr:uncharacterized protein LOC103720062 [Phoenix dactylifera]XP_038982101.1 uncharacterized protein LOC103720062 [Phoenix dactylifera]